MKRLTLFLAALALAPLSHAQSGMDSLHRAVGDAAVVMDGRSQNRSAAVDAGDDADVLAKPEEAPKPKIPVGTKAPGAKLGDDEGGTNGLMLKGALLVGGGIFAGAALGALIGGPIVAGILALVMPVIFVALYIGITTIGGYLGIGSAKSASKPS